MEHYIRIHSVYKYAGMFPTVANIQEALALVMRHYIKSEIIGSWLYCFTSPLIGYQLEAIGFWYSFKHRAFVYSGYPKDYPADDESLDQIRARLGSEQLTGGSYGKNN
jgi:hypothetical protein